MLRGWLMWILAFSLIAAILAGTPSTVQSQSADEIAALIRRGEALYQDSKYVEAIAIVERAREASERVLGSDHPLTLSSINGLGVLHHSLGRYDEAAQLYQKALAIRERILGPEHPDTLESVSNLAGLHYVQGHYSLAEPLYRRVLETDERLRGTEHPNTLDTVDALAALYSAQSRYNEAELLYRRALVGRERALGNEHPDTLDSIGGLAELYRDQARYDKAEPLLKLLLETRERVLGKEHHDTLISLNNLARFYDSQGQYDEAEPFFKRALEISERVLGGEHPSTLLILNNLAALYFLQGRYDAAEPLYKRALEARERTLGKEHTETLHSASNLAVLYVRQGQYSMAEPLMMRTLDSMERVLGEEHTETLISVNNLAYLYVVQGRLDQAEPLYKRALEARERLLGEEHPRTLNTVANLARLYLVQGRLDQAEPLYKRALEASGRVLGKDHPDTLNYAGWLGQLYFSKSDWGLAAAFWRQSTAAVARRTLRSTQAMSQALTGENGGEAAQYGSHFEGLIKAVYRVAASDRAPDIGALHETFQAAQWALGSEAARSLAQMAARGGKSDPDLAGLARNRQDLAAEWQTRDAQRNAALGEAPDKRNAEAEAENRDRLAVIDVRIAEIDKRLAAEFPDYAALANPAPLPLDEVQAQLGADEALLLFLDTPDRKPAPEETFIWVVTKTDMRWVRSDFGTAALTREVQALRCGLDVSEWATVTNGTRCGELLGLTDTYDPSRPLPFDLDKAHALHQALFGQVEDLIKGKHLLIIPSGTLTQLPFQVLVTAPSKNGDHKSAAWLARGHALTVLPAVSSLKALRRTGRPSTATKPMIGFGNPLLDGADSRYAKLAQLARDKQKCPETVLRQILGLLELRGGVPALETQEGIANVAHIRAQAPLPETADELCAVARDIGADVGEMRLGARATEREVKAMSENGKLAQYRIVHFATHGAMAGELDKSSEPGLILTPPQTASEEDDGYLSAAEIAALKLDADWVILSACNTAAGNAAKAEALSGLARAFIYAQARALLVSHWAVDSNATVKLITSAMGEIARDRTVGRAEALRRSMLALVDKGDPQEAHPSYWAPFIVVGEGAR